MGETNFRRDDANSSASAKERPAAPGVGARMAQEAERQPGAGGQFLADVTALRERARKNIEQGALTEGYRADREVVLEMLNTALATEIVCYLRYKRHYYAADGVRGEKVKEEFLEHANQEAQHADRIAERITELGGLPNYAPAGLSERSHSQYVEGATLREMMEEDLVAERVAIESYTEMIRYLGDKDITTRRLFEEILAVEEEHANDLVSLLKSA
jgi:bacterioferritin